MNECINIDNINDLIIENSKCYKPKGKTKAIDILYQREHKAILCKIRDALKYMKVGKENYESADQIRHFLRLIGDTYLHRIISLEVSRDFRFKVQIKKYDFPQKYINIYDEYKKNKDINSSILLQDIYNDKTEQWKPFLIQCWKGDENKQKTMFKFEQFEYQQKEYPIIFGVVFPFIKIPKYTANITKNTAEYVDITLKILNKQQGREENNLNGNKVDKQNINKMNVMEFSAAKIRNIHFFYELKTEDKKKYNEFDTLLDRIATVNEWNSTEITVRMILDLCSEENYDGISSKEMITLQLLTEEISESHPDIHVPFVDIHAPIIRETRKSDGYLSKIYQQMKVLYDQRRSFLKCKEEK